MRSLRLVEAVAALLLVTLAPASARASCLGVTAPQVAQGLGNVSTGALVIVGPLESDVAPSSPAKGEELALRVAGLVAGKLPNARVHAHAASLDQARALASRSSSLVYVHVQVFKGELRLTADAYPVVHNMWDRVRLPPPPPSAHAYAVAPIDAEVRAFFPPIALEQASVHKVAHSEGDVLAVGCGDLDGDGGAEIVLVSRERVALGRMRGAQFVVDKALPWSSFARRVPVPLREPIAGAEIAPSRALLGISDRGGARLDAAFASPVALEGIPVGDGQCAATIPAAQALAAQLSPCEGAPPTAAGATSADAVSAFDLVAPNGSERRATAMRDSSGRLRLRVGDFDIASFDGAGAEVAVYDGDLDGAPEVAFSASGPDDAITLASLRGGAPKVIARWPAPAGVRALGACPAEERGAPALVAVVGSEVWLVR
ncbi:MAG TPA: hypothetical protein VLM85_07925 [Polyangiaceae bacterium]|nr:hypothetical protein [Polyangiaceae bacterium]